MSRWSHDPKRRGSWFLQEVLFMKLPGISRFISWIVIWLSVIPLHEALSADKLIGFHSARTMSQAMPWIAEEAGLFRKYDLEFQLLYISSAQMVTAAMLSGDAQVAIS